MTAALEETIGRARINAGKLTESALLLEPGHSPQETTSKMTHDQPIAGRHPRWMTYWLTAAGVYNLFWGALVVLMPLAPFHWAAMAPPRYPSIWQCVGMIVGVYGIGYLVAAKNPTRHWPIVIVGLLGKVFGPIGFVLAASRGELPWKAGWTILTNDLLWWIPFALILREAYLRGGSENRGDT